jgi:hypothetical protein
MSAKSLGVAIFNRAVKEKVTEKVTFKQRPERS